MSGVRVDDVLADPVLVESMDPGLAALLARLQEAAKVGGHAEEESFDSFIVTVAPDGGISVNTDAPDGFIDWVWAAGDLARSIGPQTGLVKGKTRTVAQILGNEDDDADAEPISTTATGDTGEISAAPDADAGAARTADGETSTWSPWGAGIVVQPPAVGVVAPADLSPHWAPWTDTAADAPFVAETLTLVVYQCVDCSAVSDTAGDFKGDTIDALSCVDCGGTVVARRGIRTGGSLLVFDC